MRNLTYVLDCETAVIVESDLTQAEHAEWVMLTEGYEDSAKEFAELEAWLSWEDSAS